MSDSNAWDPTGTHETEAVDDEVAKLVEKRRKLKTDLLRAVKHITGEHSAAKPDNTQADNDQQ